MKEKENERLITVRESELQKLFEQTDELSRFLAYFYQVSKQLISLCNSPGVIEYSKELNELLDCCDALDCAVEMTSSSEILLRTRLYRLILPLRDDLSFKHFFETELGRELCEWARRREKIEKQKKEGKKE